MPLLANEVFSALGPRDLDDAIHDEYGWWSSAGIAGAIAVTAMAVATFVTCRTHVRSPLVLATLLLLAIAPFIVEVFRRVPALLCVLWTLAAFVPLELFGRTFGVYDASSGRDQIALMILVWLVGATVSVARRRDCLVALVGALALTIGRQLTDPRHSPAAIWCAGIAIAALAGLFIRALTLALVTTKLAQEAAQQQAATEERQRIAREVHDVIAHSLTVTMLHLNAARLAVRRGDDAMAVESLEEAERAGRTSLNEIRATVGLLRDGSASPAEAPQPSALDIPALVESYRAAGMPVELCVDGDLVAVEPGAGLALYRIVQESLTNAGRHAPGATTTVHVDARGPLQLTVTSAGGTTGDSPGAGHGLAGMAERTAALGGSFTAGPDGDGWRVAVRVP